MNAVTKKQLPLYAGFCYISSSLQREGQAAKIEDFADAVHFLPLVAYQQPTCRIERKLMRRVKWKYGQKWRCSRQMR